MFELILLCQLIPAYSVEKEVDSLAIEANAKLVEQGYQLPGSFRSHLPSCNYWPLTKKETSMELTETRTQSILYLRVPSILHRQLSSLSHKRGLSLNRFCEQILQTCEGAKDLQVTIEILNTRLENAQAEVKIWKERYEKACNEDKVETRP